MRPSFSFEPPKTISFQKTDYQFVKLLGFGVNGTVYLYSTTKTNTGAPQNLAVKIPRYQPHNFINSDEKDRCLERHAHEAAINRRVYNVGESYTINPNKPDALHIIVTLFIPGITLLHNFSDKNEKNLA